MNYLAHARDVADRPWEIVGVSLPDWLRVVDRRIRLRARHLRGVRVPPGSPESEILAGVRRHDADDGWFHRAAAFRETTAAIAREIREEFPDRRGRRMRASFFAHILFEMLLDAELVARAPHLPGEYYRSLGRLDPREVVERTRAIAPSAPDGLAELFARFRELRFLETYDGDAEVVARLDHVGRRLRQPPLPAGFARIVGRARGRVGERAGELLGPR